MDSISDMLAALKNAARAGHESVAVPFSKLKQSIAECLIRVGFLKSMARKTRRDLPILVLTLAYDDKIPKISEFKRVSKLSRRVYRGVRELRFGRSDLGTLVLSTPKGILTGEEARREHVGGEALFEMR